MTTTRQHIENLDPAAWAALTKRAAGVAVAAAERFGNTPPAELLAVVAMTERDLVEHRNRLGPARKRPSAVMRMVEADHLRVIAEGHARQAQQDKKDAEAAASLARAEAEQSARDATAARERVRQIQEQAARKDAELSAERAAAQQAIEQMRTELERVRADAAAEVAAVGEQFKAAEARARQRTEERTAERATARQAFEQLRGDLERVRADAAAEVAAAGERVSAAEARAEQRIAERAAERATAQQTLEQVRGELERVRADAAAEVAAARGRADAEIAAAHQAAEAQVEQIRAAAAAEIADASSQLLTIPVPPLGVSAHTGRIEHAVSVVRQIDYVLEAGLIEGAGDDVESRRPIDTELVRSLVRTVQVQAADLAEELHNLSSHYTVQWQIDAADSYASTAANAYGALLQRIATATEQLRQHDDSANAEVVQMVTTMLADHPWRRY
ncbi:hypothetical protein MSIMFB_02455 [Mycobacterium simulans]|uniref:Uncharacterized protein n=1 Tax=Mycobacterium simulans TaxID=627089 RepID=A0A7Z7NAK6_9MYCO|nr:hypothetical protein [Mycobacterium simulans]SOJ54964.1 hypothetical protein MSIMFB_02455 [Mycobacterium simulans]